LPRRKRGAARRAARGALAEDDARGGAGGVCRAAGRVAQLKTLVPQLDAAHEELGTKLRAQRLQHKGAYRWARGGGAAGGGATRRDATVT